MYNFRIRAVNAGTSAVTMAGVTIQPGNIATIAGTGIQGFSGDGGPAINAALDNPEAVWPDSAGNVYIADTDNARVRVVNSIGIISTIAGNGMVGYNGDGIAPLSASLNEPLGMDFDPSGNVVFADRANRRIRKIVSGTAGNGSSAAAQFVTQDGSTQGNWQGTYGADGYYVINGPAANIPSYATLNVYRWNALHLDFKHIRYTSARERRWPKRRKDRGGMVWLRPQFRFEHGHQRSPVRHLCTGLGPRRKIGNGHDPPTPHRIRFWF